jgi:hypothetical protein
MSVKTLKSKCAENPTALSEDDIADLTTDFPFNLRKEAVFKSGSSEVTGDDLAIGKGEKSKFLTFSKSSGRPFLCQKSLTTSSN